MLPPPPLYLQAFQRFGYTNDNMYDWVLKKDYSRSEDRELCNLLLPSPSSPRGEGGPSVLSLHVPNSRNQGVAQGAGVPGQATSQCRIFPLPGGGGGGQRPTESLWT